MGNPRLQISNESLQLRNPPSPKLIVSGNMNQTKATTGSPKSPKSPDDNSKSDIASSSQTKYVRSPSSTKSSPGSIKSVLAERLAQSARSKSSAVGKSSVSKSSPTSPNTPSVSKTDISNESIDQCNVPETNKVCNGPNEMKLENSQLTNGHQLCGIENETSKSNEVKQDVSVGSNLTEINENGEVEESEQLKSDSDNVVIDEKSVKLLRIDNSVILEQSSKKGIRQKVWEFLEENSLVVFPKPCFNRIPNFKGCSSASQSLEKLEEFKKAKTVQVTPDKAQETARFITLNWGKRLLVPLLRLKEGLLQNVSLPFAEPSTKMLKSASTQKGLRKWGTKLVTLDKESDNIHIDMIIMGSVAVDKRGYRIGIGDGYCDLEFVILSSMNMVTDNTVVVTIVHDVQVFDSLPTEIFKPYDVPVDIIITPTEIIKIGNRLSRPKDVFWNYISKRRLLEMPPLQLLRTQQEKNDVFDCTLKEVDSEPEEIPPSPKTYKKFKGYRRRRSYSTRSENNNDSVFKDTEISKRRSTSKQSSVSALKNTDSKVKHNRAKSTSSQHRTNSTGRCNNQNDKKEQRSSKKQNKRRTKSESATKAVVSPVIVSSLKNSNNRQADSPSIETPKSKRQPRQKQRQRQSDDIDKQSSRQSTTKLNDDVNYNSRSISRATRRDYIDGQDFGREISVGRKTRTEEYIPSPKKFYSQSHRHDSYSQEIPYHGGLRSNKHVQQYDSSRSVAMPQNRYSNGPVVRQTRYFNGPMARHNSYNGSSRQIDDNHHHIIRHNSYSNEPLSRQNSFYDGIISHRTSSSKGPVIRQDGYTSSRIFRPPPPQYRNGLASQTDEESKRPRFNKNHFGYFNPNEKPNYSRSISDDEFVLKVGNIANNVRVRDLKAALMERGVKPLHITWRGPRGFAYLRYGNATDVNKDCVMGTLQNVRIKPNGVETAQTQTLIVTECQFS